jgi:ArsR family transcriptional regulator
MSILDSADLEKIDSEIPQDEILYDLADLFKIFGDTTRIKILYALREAELCVGDLAELLKMNQSAVSHQLKILKQSKLVKFRRDGKTIWYSLADNHVVTIIDQGMDHIQE